MSRSGAMADRETERTPSYWATLAAALVMAAASATGARAQTAAETAPAAPPTTEATPSSEIVLLEADVLIDDQTAGSVTAEGDVQARYNGRTLRADRVTYYLETGEVHASGNVQIIGDDGSVTFAEQIQADEELNIGVATELRSSVPPNSTLAARRAIRAGEGRSELRNVIFTSCPVCEDGERPPTWTLRARRAVQNSEQRIITYEGAVFEVAGLPVLYLPYFAHPDPSVDRHSGLLTPDLGSSRRLGFYYQQPYYWAISPYQDLTVSGRVHQNVNPLLGFEYRKRFWSGRLQVEGTLTHEYEFDVEGDRLGDESTRGSLFAQGLFRLNDYWQWGFGAERVSEDNLSDSNYLKRYGLDGYGERRGPYLGDYSRLISQLYAIGQDDDSYASITMVSFQGLRPSDTDDLLPVILPVAEYSHAFDDPWLGGQFRLQANTAVLQRSDGEDAARGSVSGAWRTDAIFGPGLVVSPFALARGDLFHVETAPEDFETFGRALGYAGVELSWPLLRATENLSIVVEPVAMAAYGSQGGDDPRIVNEDSIGFELDDSNLFRPNAVSNYDLWEPGARLSLGVRATATAASGRSAQLTFGRRWRDTASPQFTTQSNLDGRASDWVGAVEANLGGGLSSEVRFRLDDETLELQRLDAGVGLRAGRFSARARYYQLNETLAPGNPAEEIAGAVSIDIARGWGLALGLRRDLDRGINIRQQISAIYEDDCTFFEIGYTRTESQTRSGEVFADEGFVVRIGLTSLGMLGGEDSGRSSRRVRN